MSTFLLLVLGACRPGADLPDPPTLPDDTGVTAVTDTDTGGTTDTDTGSDTDTDTRALSSDCTAPETLPGDPITAVGRVEDREVDYFYELTDLEVYPDRGLVVGAGQGGLMLFDISNDKPDMTASEPEFGIPRFVKIERLGGTALAASNWNEVGDIDLGFYDISDPADIIETQKLSLALASGMGWSDPYLNVLTLDGRLHVFDASDTSDVQAVTTVGGLDSPYEMEIVGDWGYVADAPLGLVPVDLSDPRAPVVGQPLPDTAGAWDVAATPDHLAVALGQGGIRLYDLADPSSPSLLAHLDDVGSVVGVDLEGALLLAVSHQDLLAFDVTDPAAPVALGKQDHNQFGLAVQAAEGRAYVADWAFLSVWGVDMSVRSPEADLQSSAIYFYDGEGSKSLEITNLGAAPLSLVGASVDDERVTLGVTETAIPPGGSADLVLQFSGGDDLDAELCLATNDPDEPILTLPVQSTSTDGIADLAVGQPAPDFTLTSIDGETVRLSDQLGGPVVLVYFATW